MKNQYFGDIHDYLKYTVLRVLAAFCCKPMLVVWMLTPDDRSTDGGKREYLDRRHPDAHRWSSLDPRLYSCLACLDRWGCTRTVEHVEKHALIHHARFFANPVPKDRVERNGAWIDSLVQHAKSCSLIFLDPDNGIEVHSVPKGRKRSEKYVYWNELECLWKKGKSILVYQHFPREDRTAFIRRITDKMRSRFHGSRVEAYQTKHVLFLWAIQNTCILSIENVLVSMKRLEPEVQYIKTP